MTTARRLLVLGAALLAAGCNPNTQGQPESSTTSPTPSSTTSTPAPIDGFPDMSSYIQVNRRDYLVVVPHSPALKFSTPETPSCWLGANSAPEQAYASCIGPRPDKGPGDWEITATRSETATIIQAPPPGNANYVAPTPRVLPPGHVLRNDPDQFCGVDDKGTVACRVGDHGFVLTPTSTKLF